jgi:hypothetical protein
MARLAGFEPATGCLEDTAMLSEQVAYLCWKLYRVRGGVRVVRLVGVSRGCHLDRPGWPVG